MTSAISVARRHAASDRAQAAHEEHQQHEQPGVDRREHRQRRPDAADRRRRVGGAHDAVDHPRLPADLGDHPAGLEREEAERAAQDERDEQQARQRRVAAARRASAPASTRARAPSIAMPAPTMIWNATWVTGDVRPLVARDAIEADHLGVEAAVRQEAERPGDLDRVARLAALDVGPAADRERRAALRLEHALPRPPAWPADGVRALGQEIAGERHRDRRRRSPPPSRSSARAGRSGPAPGWRHSVHA